jgi:hypothetical protein
MNPGISIRFGNNATHKKARRTLGATAGILLISHEFRTIRDVIAAATTSAVWSCKNSRPIVRVHAKLFVRASRRARFRQPQLIFQLKHQRIEPLFREWIKCQARSAP